MHDIINGRKNKANNPMDEIKQELTILGLETEKLDRPFISHLINVAVMAIDDECLSGL